ncbi:hypothetical protein STANM309S_03946 [Streptomyces tanashiensis]
MASRAPPPRSWKKLYLLTDAPRRRRYFEYGTRSRLRTRPQNPPSRPVGGGKPSPRSAYRNYRLFFTGAIVSNTGTWMARITQDWLVLSLTGSAAAVGITTALQFLPMLLFG